MVNHPGDPTALLRIAQWKRAETVHRAEQRRLIRASSIASAPESTWRKTAASALRALADRVSPAPSEAAIEGPVVEGM